MMSIMNVVEEKHVMINFPTPQLSDIIQYMSSEQDSVCLINIMKYYIEISNSIFFQNTPFSIK